MLQNKLIEGEELAIAVAKHAFENKAKKIEVLNLKGISTIADYFVICTVDSLPQLKALRRDVDKEIKSIHSVTPRAIEGTPESLWLIIDYVDVIFHIFHTKICSVDAEDVGEAEAAEQGQEGVGRYQLGGGEQAGGPAGGAGGWLARSSRRGAGRRCARPRR